MHSTFSETVRTRRRALGLTLDQLSERSHVAKSRLSAIENGLLPREVAQVAVIADALELDRAELLFVASPKAA